MNNTSKSTKKATPMAAAAVKAEFVDAFTPLYLNSVERLSELQKKSLDVAAEQSADWLHACKKAFSYFPVTPAMFVFDIAEHAVETYVDTQKTALDIVVQQSHSVAGIAKDRAEAYTKSAHGLTAMFQQAVEHSVEAQKKVLDSAAAQSKTIFEATKQQLGPAGAPVAAVVDSFQSGTDALIQTQKAVIDIAAEPLKSAAAGL